MKLLTHEKQWHGGETVIALGMFDGVHEGHAALMRKARQLGEEEGLSSIVYTFSSHPMATFAPDRIPPQLFTRSEKILAIAKLGLDAAVLRPFDAEYASQSPEEFVRAFCEALHPRHVVVGFNYSFGKMGKGKAEDMIRLGRQYGFETHVVDEVRIGGAPVSSTRIRGLISEGKMEEAAQLLGGEYTISGVIQHGKKLGRTLDFPTANLKWPKGKAIPPKGVYACQAYLNGAWYCAAVNIGTHPTAPQGEPTIEANLLNYDGGECYGAHMRLALYHFLRPEKKFESLDALRAEVLRNREQTAQYFQNVEIKF